MGNLHHDGDHDILIDAWTILQSQGDAPDLCIIGGGPCLESVKSDVEQRGLTQIKFLGYLPVQENQNYLHHAHGLLFPIRDTIGNQMRCPSKTFAYMQAGRPIVTCRVGEVAEALGDQGIYVEPTPETFAQKVLELFQQPPQTVVYDLERHTWEARAKDLLRAIQAIHR
jgi:glycosyltransferase involved in cell wall biosynthesis